VSETKIYNIHEKYGFAIRKAREEFTALIKG